jgi:hypothetical protein
MKKLIGLFAVTLLLSVPALAQERQRRGQPENQQQQKQRGLSFLSKRQCQDVSDLGCSSRC